MLKIATHNSLTGENGKGLISKMLTPFCKCQSKTIQEQLEAGCTMFDIRLKPETQECDCTGQYGTADYMCMHGGHGLWTSFPTAAEALRTIDYYAFKNNITIYVSIVFECDRNKYTVPADILTQMGFKFFPHITFTYAAYKFSVEGNRHDYDFIQRLNAMPPNRSDFEVFDGRDWHTYMPIPWLWKKLRHNHTEFNEKTYIYVDFL